MIRHALVVLALVGCGKKQDDSKAQPSQTATASSEGARPAAGNPGSSTDPADLPYKLKPLHATEAPDIATLKQRTQSDVREWLSEETTPDGFIVTYSTPVLGGVQDEAGQVRREETGLEYGVYVRRVIDGTPYKCVARLPRREDLAAVVAACKTAKP